MRHQDENPFDFDLSLDPIKSSVNPYFKRELFRRKEKHVVYSRSRIALGLKRTGGVYYLDTTEALRMLIVGITRSGKTFILRGFGDRATRSGYSVVYLPDVKDEFKSSKEAVQEKFRKGLLEGEKAEPTNVMTFRPTFFKTVRGYENLPVDNYWYTPNLTDISELDFMTMMKADELTEPQRIAMKEIYTKLAGYQGNVDLNIIYNLIDELEDFDDRQKMSLRTKFLPLKYSHMLSDVDTNEIRKGLDFERMIKAGVLLSLNMEGFDNISREGAGLPQVFVSIWLRKIINLRRKKQIGSLFIITDEASRFIPVDSNPSCKLEFMESVDLDTRYGINYIFATQSAQKLPENVVTQCKYMLIPYNADIDTFRYLFKISGAVSWSLNVYAQRCAELKKRMKKYEWVIINRNTNSYDIIKSLSPLSAHAETTA